MKDATLFLQAIQKRKNARSETEAISDPSLLEDRKNVLDLNILVCIDVSGSISNQQFQDFMRQIDAIRGLSRVKVIEIDTTIVAMYDYFKTSQSMVKRRCGTGGTEFTEAFQSAKKMQPDAILFMTDGMVAGSVPDPKIPTGWILTRGGVKPYGFGEVILTMD